MKLMTVDDKPRLCLFVIVDKINPDEEITYNYGPGDHSWRVCLFMIDLYYRVRGYNRIPTKSSRFINFCIHSTFEKSLTVARSLN